MKTRAKLSKAEKAEAIYLIENKEGIYKEMINAGMYPSVDEPNVWYVPTFLSFENRDRNQMPITALYAVMLMARVRGIKAHWKDTDSEGMPSIYARVQKKEGWYYPMYIGAKMGREIAQAPLKAM